MRLPSFLLIGSACVTTGAAMYVSRGVLDRVPTPEGSIRLALLPPWQTLAGFAAVAALGLLLLARPATRRTPAGTRRVPVAALVPPLFALAALLIPYLPYLPDRLPVLQMLAGPARYLVWTLVLTQLAWVLWDTTTRRATLFDRWSVRACALGLGAASLLVTGVAAVRMTSTDLYPGGDEPHYLIIAQSLWNDGDFKIENNHSQGDYAPYFRQPLAPHYLTRGTDGEIYSIHPVGLPIILAPVYGLGGYLLVVAFMLMLAAVAASLMWRWVVAHTGQRGAATFAWAAIVLSPPFALNSFAVYPEFAAALAVVGALATMPRTDEDAGRLARWMVTGLLAGTLPWLSTKYAPMSAAVAAVALSRIWWLVTAARPIDAAAKIRRSLAVALPYFAMLLAWFTFFYVIWGAPRPQAPYGALAQTSPFNLIFGAPGLLFDQEYGLLVFAPVYALAATGLFIMWRTGGELRRRALELLLIAAALLATVGAFRIWWGGSAAPARPLVSGLLLLALPIAVAFHAAGVATARRAAQHLLLWAGAFVTMLLVVAENGLLINNGRDGTSSVLEYLSPLWEAWTLAPTFVHHEAPTSILHAVVWLVIAAAAAWLLRRWRTTTAAAASLAALLTLFTAFLAVALVMPWLPADPPWPRVALANRARLAALDRFDQVALPNAVLYDPLTLVTAREAQSRLVLEVEAGARRDSQPVRVLQNGRFSLPAGRYRLTVRYQATAPLPATGPESVGLQLGRLGAPVRMWSITPVAGSQWESEIDVPLDTGFVGLTGSPALERSIAQIALTPVIIVDRSRRPSVPPVLAAAQYGPSMVLFHDARAYPERTGFWTAGGQRTQLAIAGDNHRDDPVSLLVRSGPQINRVQLSARGWHQTLDLQPASEAIVTLPASTRGVLELQIETAANFVPATLDPASLDQRHLGVWIEVKPAPPSAPGARE